MTMPTFTWNADPDTQGSFEFAVLSAQFGDGYEQTAEDGINNEKQSWPLVFSRPAAEATQIRDFLRATKGTAAFLWTPPLGAEGTYKCKAFQMKAQDLNNYVVSALFEEKHL